MNLNTLSNPNRLRALRATAIAVLAGSALSACASDPFPGREEIAVAAIEEELTSFVYDINGTDTTAELAYYGGELDITGNIRETFTADNSPDTSNKVNKFEEPDVVFQDPVILTPNSTNSDRWAGAQDSDGKWYWAKVDAATDQLDPNLILASPVGDSTLQINQ